MKPPRHPHRPPSRGPKSSWEAVSDWYASYLAQPGTIQRDVVFPGALRLLEARAGGRYLDIACGEGAFTRLATKRTSSEWTGVDASPTLIAKAKSYRSPMLNYRVADAADFADRFEPKYFDGAVCILAIQNLDPPAPVFRDAVRVLKNGSPLVLVMNHPCFRQPRQSGWGWDEARRLQYRRVDRYLTPYEQPILMHPGASPDAKTFSYHRPLSTYVNELARRGFAIDAMEEWISPKKSDSGPRAKAENTAREEIPLFLALRAKKISPSS